MTFKDVASAGMKFAGSALESAYSKRRNEDSYGVSSTAIEHKTIMIFPGMHQGRSIDQDHFTGGSLPVDKKGTIRRQLESSGLTVGALVGICCLGAAIVLAGAFLVDHFGYIDFISKIGQKWAGFGQFLAPGVSFHLIPSRAPCVSFWGGTPGLPDPA